MMRRALSNTFTKLQKKPRKYLRLLQSSHNTIQHSKRFNQEILSRSFFQRTLNNDKPAQQIKNNHEQIDNVKVGDLVEGSWRVDRKSYVEEFKVTLFQLTHLKTGAQFINIYSPNDSNNTFCLSFKTIPFSSCGEAHILEHTTLCGSKKYPVRDMFFNMYSRSLNTYMNAWTGCDFTSYPFSTQNQTDYYNLMSVYVDACFFPLLHEYHFAQEGHRFEFEDTAQGKELKLKGVVFNEMKGAMGDPSQYFHRKLLAALYPGTAYAYNSGGDPFEIPKLSHEQLKKFHQSYYHPSNCQIYTYGNFPLQTHLKYLNQFAFDQFKVEANTQDIKPGNINPIFKDAQRLRIMGPPDPMATDDNKQTKFAISFLTNSRKDNYETFAMSFLSSLLLDEPRGPFYQSIIESGLAPDFSPGTGYESSLSVSNFTIGVQGIEESKIDGIEKEIMKTFEKVKNEGVDQTLIDSTIHHLELSIKTISPHFGLGLCSSMVTEWMHGNEKDLSQALTVNEKLLKLKKELQNGTFFSNRIEKYFLKNTHKVLLTMVPDKNFVDKEHEKEKSFVENKLSEMKETDKQDLIKFTEKMKESQNSEPDKSCLPSLTISDISRIIPDPIYLKQHHHGQCDNIYYNEQITNGIVYVTILFKLDFAKIPDELKPYVPLFTDVLTKMGAKEWNHTKLAEEIELYTGGISSSLLLLPSLEKQNNIHDNNFDVALSLTSHCLERNTEKMIDLISAIYTDPKLQSDTNFLKAQIDQAATSLTNVIMQNGHQYARLLASSHLTSFDSLNEKYSGLTFIQEIQSLSSYPDAKHVATKLQELTQYLLISKDMKVLLTCEPQYSTNAHRHVENFLSHATSMDQHLPSTNINKDEQVFNSKVIQAYVPIPSQVSFTSQALLTAPFLHKDNCNLRLAGTLLNTHYLHKEIREKGGAYGSGTSQSMNGVFAFTSYRDPDPFNTLKVYNNAANWANQKGSFNQKELEEAKLQVFQELDSPQTPHGKGKSFFLFGVTEEMRQMRRNYFLDATKADIIDVCNRYLDTNGTLKQRSVAVVGPQDSVPKNDTSGEVEWVIY